MFPAAKLLPTKVSDVIVGGIICNRLAVIILEFALDTAIMVLFELVADASKLGFVYSL